jgi:hypothetical protein
MEGGGAGSGREWEREERRGEEKEKERRGEEYVMYDIVRLNTISYADLRYCM